MWFAVLLSLAAPLPAQDADAEKPAALETIQDFDEERSAVQDLMDSKNYEAALRRVDRVLTTPLADDIRRIEWESLRVLLLVHLRRTTEAQAAAQALDPQLGQSPAWPSEPRSLIEDDDDFVRDVASVIAVGIVGGGIAFIVFAINLAVSWRQKSLGKGSVARWVGVAAGCTLLGFLPLLTWFAALFLFPGLPHGAGLTVATTATSGVIFGLMLTLLRPVRMMDGRPLLDVESGPLVERVSELARRMGVRPPIVRRIPAISSDADAMAFLSGLPAYTLLVTDGLERRLKPAEKDAILAHELAHIANGSLWWYALIVPAAASVTVLLTMLAAWRDVPLDGSFATLMMFGAAAAVGIKRLFGRALEYDSDRRAARTTRFQDMASALQTIHAINRLPESGLLSWLTHATAVHPSNDERIDALDWRAPVTDLVQVSWKKEEASARRWAARLAGGLWLAALGISAALLLSPAHTRAEAEEMTGAGYREPVAAGILLVTALLPIAIVLVLGVRLSWRARRQTSLWPRWPALAFVVWLTCVLAMAGVLWTRGLQFLPLPGSPSSARLFFHCAILFGLGIILIHFLFVRVLGFPHVTWLDRQVMSLLLSRKYGEVLDLAARHRKKIERSPVSRHNIAFARALAGDMDGAINDLRAITAGPHRTGRSVLCLAALQLEEGRPAEAIEATREFQALLPNDPDGVTLEGEALRLQGKLDEAWSRAEWARSLDPADGRPRILQARVAICRHDGALAEELLSEAEALAPGDMLLDIARFELARERGDDGLARRHLDRVSLFVEATPVTLYQKRLARLEALMEAADVHEKAEAEGLAEPAEARSAIGSHPPDVSRSTGPTPGR